MVALTHWVCFLFFLREVLIWHPVFVLDSYWNSSIQAYVSFVSFIQLYLLLLNPSMSIRVPVTKPLWYIIIILIHKVFIQLYLLLLNQSMSIRVPVTKPFWYIIIIIIHNIFIQLYLLLLNQSMSIRVPVKQPQLHFLPQVRLIATHHQMTSQPSHPQIVCLKLVTQKLYKKVNEAIEFLEFYTLEKNNNNRSQTTTRQNSNKKS